MKAKSAIKNKIIKGWGSETLAMLYFLVNGYVPVARNIVTPYGETDLLLRKRNDLIVVEVKFRQTQERGHYAIHPNQQERIIRQGRFYQKKYKGLDVRFDAFFVFTSWPFIDHVESIWEV